MERWELDEVIKSRHFRENGGGTEHTSRVFEVPASLAGMLYLGSHLALILGIDDLHFAGGETKIQSVK